MKRQIPNMLSVLRLFMIPVFVWSYFKYTMMPKVFISAGVYFLAWLTDALDGYLARRNGWITDLGKLLDPLADKLMQIAAAACFTVDNKLFYIVLIPLVIKECGMIFASMAILRKSKVVVQAHWYGKVATVILFGCAFIRIVVRNSPVLDWVICGMMLCLLVFSLTMYYLRDFRGKYDFKLFLGKKR